MIRAVIVASIIALAGPAALGQVEQDGTHAPEKQAAQSCMGIGEPACMFEVIWEAAALLPEKKRARLVPVFLETVALSEDEGLLADWQDKTGAVGGRRAAYANYAAEKVTQLIEAEGWESFLTKARAKQAPFNIGRPEVMAAGAELADETMRARIVEAMFELAGTRNSGRMGDDFERGDFGHALSEMAMRACDLESFDRAVAMTGGPDSLRYALWRARMTGKAGELTSRILQDADKDDTRHVRQALEGYASVLALGYCDQPSSDY